MRKLLLWAGLLWVAGSVWAQTPTVTHDAVKPVEPGDVIKVTATGPAGAVATYSIQGHRRPGTMTENPPGTYTAEYTVRRGELVNDRVVVVTLRMPDGSVLNGQSANAVGQPLPPPPVAPTTIEVRAVKVDPTTWVRAGQMVTITVDATPGCQITVTAGILFQGLPMVEQRPGKYALVWTVTKLPYSTGRPTFYLRITKDGRSEVVPITSFIGVDNVAPLALGSVPGPGDVAPPTTDTIAIAYDDIDGSDLDPNLCKIALDGTPIIGRVRFDSGWATYTLPRPLSVGAHRLTYTLVDRVGNASKDMNCPFTVGDPTPQLVVTHTATRDLQPGDSFIVRLTAPTGGRATYTIGRGIVDQPMAEVRTGVYEAEYVVRRNDKLAGEAVVVNFRSADGKNQQVKGATALPGGVVAPPVQQGLVPPTFTAPLNGATLTGATAITGTSTPGAKVELTIDSVGRVAGFLEVHGDTVKLAAMVNADGKWATAPFAFERPGLAGKTTFTIVAVTVQNDKRSDATTIKVDR